MTPSATATATATATVTATPTMTPVPPIIIDCYQITFLGVVYQPDNTSTWTYQVTELPCAQGLSNWMVALPSCALLAAATSEPWEYVNPDPNYHLIGVKWQVGAGFEQGIFTVTVNGHWTVGPTQVGVKGPEVGIGLTAGPICVPVSPMPLPTGSVTLTAIPSATPVLTPTATISATATVSAPVPPTFTATPLPTATQAPPTATPVPPRHRHNHHRRGCKSHYGDRK